MLVTLAELAASVAVGIAIQQTRHGPQALRAGWFLSFSVLGPVVTFYAFSTIALDDRTALLAGLAALTVWSTLGVGYLYGSLVGRDLTERAALAISIGFSNTGFVGYILAQTLFGRRGLQLMVFYDQIAFMIPAISISTAIVRVHAGTTVTDRHLASDFLRRLLVNPPLAGTLVALALRLVDVRMPGLLGPLGIGIVHTVGPLGFLVVGLSVPLGRLALEQGEVVRGVGAMAVRYLVGPCLLALWALVLGLGAPTTFYLATVLPAATHLLVLSRLYSLRPPLIRLLVVVTTVLSVTGAFVYAAVRS